MIADPFVGPRLKTARAKKLIAELESEEASFVGSTAFSFSDLDEAKLRRTVIFSNSPPQEIGCIVGDIVHNLRASLDILLNDIGRLRGMNTTSFKFPFATDADHLEARIKSMKLSHLGNDVVDEIRILKPYRGGNQPLRDLHDLDISDKHEFLIPVFGATTATYDPSAIVSNSMKSFLLSTGEYQDISEEMKDKMFEIDGGASFALIKDGVVHIHPRAIGLPELQETSFTDGEIVFFGTDRKPEYFYNSINKNIHINFPKGDFPFSGRHVVLTLRQISQKVEGVIENFCFQFGGSEKVS